MLVVCLFTLVASALIGFLGGLSVGLWGMTGGYAAAESGGSGLPPFYYTFTVPLYLLAFYAFVLSIFMLFKHSKYVWVGAITFWIANASFFTFCSATDTRFFEADLLQTNLTFLLVPLLYSLGSITYFMTSNIRKYFDV